MRAFGLIFILIHLTSCSQTELETSEARVRSKPVSQEPVYKSEEAVPQEVVVPPANISGSYLIGCELTNTKQVQSSPAQVGFSCSIQARDGAAISADGFWMADLLTPAAGDQVTVLDGRLGTFSLTAENPTRLLAALDRTSIRFRGTVDGKSQDLNTAGGDSLKPQVSQAQVMITYDFVIQIVSGSRTGQAFSGSVQYAVGQLEGLPQETLRVPVTRFTFLPVDQQVFDGPAILTLNQGVLTQILFSGGPGNQRFGVNTGFDRNQFGRTEEAFVRNGDQFFGYLDAAGFVDGAGTIRYIRR